MYTTFIFDLDGTLLNTLPDLAAAVNHALTRHALPALPLDSVRRLWATACAASWTVPLMRRLLRRA